MSCPARKSTVLATCVVIAINCSAGIAEAPYTIEWTRQLGTSAEDSGYGVATDSSGSVWIAGHTKGSLGAANAGGYDAFLSKYDSSGGLLWTSQLGTSASDAGTCIATDDSGHIYITGTTGGPLGASEAHSSDAFLTKYDASGNLLWIRQHKSYASDYGCDVATDNSGNIYMSGSTMGRLGVSAAGGFDAFLSKYDSSGNLLWTRQLGTARREYGSGVATDAWGNVCITGYTKGSLVATNAGGDDVFLSKYNASGDLLWTRQFGTPEDDCGYDAATDGSGNVYITGMTKGSLQASNAGLRDAFLSKFNNSGNVLWTRQFGTLEKDYGRGVATDRSGNVYISGQTSGILGASSAGGSDAFLRKYDSSGNLLWTCQFGTPERDTGNGVAIDASGNVYMSGNTNGALGASNAGGPDAFIAKLSILGPAATVQLRTRTADPPPDEQRPIRERSVSEEYGWHLLALCGSLVILGALVLIRLKWKWPAGRRRTKSD